MSELSKNAKLKKLYDYGSHMTPTKWAKAVDILCEESNENDSNIINITHLELYNLRYSSKLVPGQKYRITDYSRKPISEHIFDREAVNISTFNWFINPNGGLFDKITLFDVIVTANDNNSLNEYATLSLKNPDQKIAIVTDETNEKIIYFYQDGSFGPWNGMYVPIDENNSESLMAKDGVIDNKELIVEYKYLKDWIQIDKWTCKYNLDNYINDNSYEFVVTDWNETANFDITCYIRNGVFYIKGVSEDDSDDRFIAKFNIKDVNQDIITIEDLDIGSIKLNFKSEDCILYEGTYSYPDLNTLLNNGFISAYYMCGLNNRISSGAGYIYNMIDQWGNESDFDHSGNTYIKILEGDIRNIKYITNWTKGPLYKGMYDGSSILIADYPIILNGSKDSEILLSKLQISPEFYSTHKNIGLICTNSNLYKTILVSTDTSEIKNIHISNWNFHDIQGLVTSVATSSNEQPIFGYTGSNKRFTKVNVIASDYIINISDDKISERE